jgi:hypothetical protein
MINFDQTRRIRVRQIPVASGGSGSIMAIPKNDKHKSYARYAEHCLSVVTSTRDQDARAINREMAAEWLKLADALLHPLKRIS